MLVSVRWVLKVLLVFLRMDSFNILDIQTKHKPPKAPPTSEGWVYLNTSGSRWSIFFTRLMQTWILSFFVVLFLEASVHFLTIALRTQVCGRKAGLSRWSSMATTTTWSFHLQHSPLTGSKAATNSVTSGCNTFHPDSLSPTMWFSAHWLTNYLHRSSPTTTLLAKQRCSNTSHRKQRSTLSTWAKLNFQDLVTPSICS